MKPGGDCRGDDRDELYFLLRRGRGADPIAGLQVSDELSGGAQGNADHARKGHHEKHAGGAGEPEL